MITFVTLFENTACRAEVSCGHGLSQYIETPRHKILFDMGPDGRFWENAQTLGVDLTAVDVAVLSHGHYDHGGGLSTFLEGNLQAEVCIHQDAFGDYYAMEPEGPKYIGLDPVLWQFEGRILPTAGAVKLDDELSLLSDVPEIFPGGLASAKLREKVGEAYRPDGFSHEQSLLINTQGKAVLFAGCAHRGIVNIIAAAEQHLGRRPDAVVAGFHLFQLTGENPAADALIEATGQALLAGETVYYTGHCTGDYAYETLKAILGDRLRPISGGVMTEI